MEYEVLFRGKRLDNGEWAESAYQFGTMSGGTVVHDFDPATVGQYTGLADKNGVKIFKGDILRVVTPNTRGNFQVKFGYGQFYIGINMPIAYVRHSCEVRGNVHDNPELLGGAE